MTGPTHAIGYLYEYNGLWEDPYSLHDFGDGYISRLPLDPRKCQTIRMGKGLPSQEKCDDDKYSPVWFVSQIILPTDACIRGELTLHLASRAVHIEGLSPKPLLREWIIPTKEEELWQMIAIPYYNEMYMVSWSCIKTEYVKVLKRGESSILPIEDLSM